MGLQKQVNRKHVTELERREFPDGSEAIWEEKTEMDKEEEYRQDETGNTDDRKWLWDKQPIH